MRHKVPGLFIVSLLLLSACAPLPPTNQAAVLPDLAVAFTLPSAKWQVSRTAPAFLVAELAEHVAHDLEEQGQAVDSASIEAAVAKRLAANEYFIFNPASGAHLEIDFSPLEPGAMPPDRATVADSARYAAESLEGEEGVSQVVHTVGKVRLPGADYVYRLEASFLKHEVPTRFYGLIGFAGHSWFFMYYTDPGQDETDYPEALTLFRSMQLVRGQR